MRIALFYIMILLYVGAGINHFINPHLYLKIMPFYIPFKMEAVFISGLCEIIFAILLLFNSTRKLGVWLIIAMLISFFAVHVQMVFDNWSNKNLFFWILILRIPLQFALIYWAYLYLKPFQKNSNITLKPS
jgi:uncharacterized membrane protein